MSSPHDVVQGVETVSGPVQEIGKSTGLYGAYSVRALGTSLSVYSTTQVDHAPELYDTADLQFENPT